MSLELHEALAAWLKAAQSPEPPEAVQLRGLCAWVGGYAAELADELKEYFSDEYPFDFGDPATYLSDRKKHKNPRRLAWVRQQLGA
jgi:hypothetical protein